MLTSILNVILGLIWLFLSTWLHGLNVVIVILFFLLFCQIIFLKNQSGDQYELTGIILVFMIGSSWLISGNNYVIFLISFVFFLLTIFHSNNNYKISLKDINSNFLTEPNNSLLLFILILITTNSIELSDKTYVYDSLHPSYEHSIGNSFSRSITESPDLSFIGKNLQWHFLGSQLSRSFRSAGYDFFESVYLITPSILFILLFHLFTSFLKKETGYLFTSFFIFFPIGSESILSRFILLFMPSYSLGFILFILSYNYFKEKKYYNYFFYSTLLIFSKGSFYPVLLGFVFLKYIISSSSTKKLYLYLFAVKMLIFCLTYTIFYNEAHPHNHWHIFSFLYKFLIESEIIETFFLLGIIIFLIFNYFNTNKNLFNSDLIIISGMLGSLLVFESAENNHLQFFYAVYPFIILTLLKREIFKNKFILFIWFFLFFDNNQPFKTSMYNVIKKLNDIGVTEFYLRSKDVGYSYENLTSELYSKLNQLSGEQNSLIWFPTFYEIDPNFYLPKDGFLRSAISNRQFYTENMKYKGIIMEPNFSKRVSNSFLWYDKFIKPSEENKKKYNRILYLIKGYDSGSEYMQNKSNSTRLQIARVLGLKKDISWNNVYAKKLKEINDYINNGVEVKFDDQITHVVLENGDTLKGKTTLKNDFKLVFSNKKGQIWQKVIQP